MKKILILIAASVISYMDVAAQFKIVGYIANFSTPAMVEYVDKFDFSKVTHINVAFFNPDADGNFPAAKGVGVDQIVAKAHQKNVKVLLSLAGGSDQSQYADLLMPEKRTAFIAKIMDLVALYKVDGIDVDIEGKNIDKNYEGFVLELSAQLKAKNKLITGAVAWWTRSKITDACLKAYDFINIMSYGGNANLHASSAYAQQHINYWKEERGMPASKLVLGTAFYGRYDLEDKKFVAIKFKDLIEKYPEAIKQDSVVRAEDGRVIRFNGINGTKARTMVALEQCGGVMIWQLLQDAEGQYSLLNAINEQLGTSTSTKSKKK